MIPIDCKITNFPLYVLVFLGIAVVEACWILSMLLLLNVYHYLITFCHIVTSLSQFSPVVCSSSVNVLCLNLNLSGCMIISCSGKENLFMVNFLPRLRPWPQLTVHTNGCTFQVWKLSYSQDSSCRMCHSTSETIFHLLSACPILAATEYLKHHNSVASLVHSLCSYFGVSVCDKPWLHVPEPVPL